ncbi:MAG: TonB-dependent receptor plug domain-containing protein [Flavobacteriaceae bacterium]|nr:TonB-dependent receptor plug domain-containing protein [Flavobacteriaceae bacterium]
MIRIITFLLLFSSFLSHSQDDQWVEVNLNAFVLDYTTQKAIPFVEVKIKNKNIGTLTDSDGKFSLNYFESNVDDDDVFQLTVNGYDTLSTSLSRLYKFLNNTNKFYLNKINSNNQWFEEDTDNGNFIFGKIFNVKGPIQGASIKVKNSLIEAKSDFEGFFKIKADVDDVLMINYLGMIEKQLFIEDLSDKYVLLKTNTQILDQVTITGSSDLNDEVDTGYGKKKKKSLGFSTSTITSEDISPAALTIVDAIRGKFANVQVAYDQDGAATGNKQKVYVRGGSLSINNSAAAIFDVEGFIYPDVPDFIDPQQIESITLLRSMSATNRYGSQGRGGVFLVKLKSLARKTKRLLNTLEVKGNDYTEQIYSVDLDSFIPYYIKDYKNANSITEAKKTFFKLQKNIYELSIPFYIESYNYFKKLDYNFAVEILKTVSQKAKDNPKALKTIAYKLEESGDYEKAKIIYKRLLNIRPEDEQTYRDLALIYIENKEYELAASMYNKMLKNKIPNVNVLGLQETIVNEASHLYWTKADKLILTDFPLKTLKTFIPENDWKNFGYDYRIVFDWNDPAVEFNIQFVDPKNKYFNWSHTIIDDKEILEDELNYGYNTEEFIIEKSDKGDWIINIENYSIEDNNNPTYIKYTVYKNYGRPNEIRKVELLDLSKLKQKVTLDVLKYYN